MLTCRYKLSNSGNMEVEVLSLGARLLTAKKTSLPAIRGYSANTDVSDATGTYENVIYVGNIYVGNICVGNIYVDNTYVGNIYAGNIYVGNIYVGNMYICW